MSPIWMSKYPPDMVESHTVAMIVVQDNCHKISDIIVMYTYPFRHASHPNGLWWTVSKESLHIRMWQYYALSIDQSHTVTFTSRWPGQTYKGCSHYGLKEETHYGSTGRAVCSMTNMCTCHRSFLVRDSYAVFNVWVGMWQLSWLSTKGKLRSRILVMVDNMANCSLYQQLFLVVEILEI